LVNQIGNSSSSETAEEAGTPDSNDAIQSESIDSTKTNESESANSSSSHRSPFPSNWTDSDIKKAIKASINGVETVIDMGGRAANFVIKWYPVVI